MLSNKYRINLFFNLFFFVYLASAQVTLPPQCYTYSTINDPSRNIAANGLSQCDVSFMSGTTWYRFTGNGGTQIPTTPTNPDRCGTQVTGWYAGMMPTISETITNGQVCFSWGNNTCQWSNAIDITNCGSYYVYRLTLPPICNARYCTETVSVLTTTTVPYVAPQCVNHTTINDSSRSIDYTGRDSKCDQNTFNATPQWVRFTGSGGDIIPTSAASQHRCGGDATGWYSGKMPTDLYETENGSVCFLWQANSCAWSTHSQVTNCGSYYVYQLRAPTACSLRYCTENSQNSITTSTTATTPIMISTTPIVPDQCTTYRTINDSTRHVNSTVLSQCDQNFLNSGSEWIRFEGPGGTQIPTSLVATHRCGTHSTGWYRDEMPNTLYSTTSGVVCFNWDRNTCNWSTNIKVTNCGSYYVYQLTRPSGCQLRYCTVDP